MSLLKPSEVFVYSLIELSILARRVERCEHAVCLTSRPFQGPAGSSRWFVMCMVDQLILPLAFGLCFWDEILVNYHGKFREKNGQKTNFLCNFFCARARACSPVHTKVETAVTDRQMLLMSVGHHSHSYFPFHYWH